MVPPRLTPMITRSGVVRQRAVAMAPQRTVLRAVRRTRSLLIGLATAAKIPVDEWPAVDGLPDGVTASGRFLKIL